MSAQTSLYPELAREIAPAQGKLGVLLPGLGAVATTLIAGVHLVSKGLAQPYGSLTQLQKLRLGKRTHPRFVCIKDLVPLAGLAGIQEWLSFYFKAPMCRADLHPEHDLFIQHLKLANTLRILVGEEVLDHSGLDYYEGTKDEVESAGDPQ